MVFGLSGFQSQAITYPNDNVEREHIHYQTIEGFVLYQSAHKSFAFLLDVLFFDQKTPLSDKLLELIFLLFMNVVLSLI